MGPIFLNVSSTKKTTENSKEKYWFAIRIKIPADDSETGGGPKFLYFNPDDSDNIGEGAITMLILLTMLELHKY